MSQVHDLKCLTAAGGPCTCTNMCHNFACGKIFVRQDPVQRFCTPKCRKHYHRAHTQARKRKRLGIKEKRL